jgi:hypothetical protein
MMGARLRGIAMLAAACTIIFFTVLRNMDSILSDSTAQANQFQLSGNKYASIQQKDQLLPEMTKDDIIHQTRSAFVIPEYKLIFFTFPKVACSEWKRMFMRINGNPNWCKVRKFNAHDPKQNEIKVLHDFEPEVATAMMTSPVWTKAAIFREPKERVLSAFLDKAVKEDYYVRKCCKNLPTDKLQQQCIDNEKKFESFLYFVTEYPDECFDVHWEPQMAKIDPKWWPYIDIIGYQHNLLNDSKRILSQLTSTRTRDDHESGKKSASAWERYGVTGWGASDECENRPHSFLEENSSAHNLDTGSHLLEWYTPETETLVEEKWAIEWSIDKVKFPKLELFPK